MNVLVGVLGTFWQVAMVVELLGALGAGNWTDFFRILGSKSAIGDRDGACAPVGGEAIQSPFALRVRCLCYGMLLPVRVHALSALNRSLSKGERVPLVSRTLALSTSQF